MAKKQEGPGKEKNRETLEGIATRGDYKIEREVQEDGSVKYFHPVDWQPENVTEETLYDIVNLPIMRLRSLMELLDGDDYGRFGFVAEGIVESAERLQGEIFHFLKEAVGEITVDVMERHSTVYRAGRVLAVRIAPPKNARGVSV